MIALVVATDSRVLRRRPVRRRDVQIVELRQDRLHPSERVATSPFARRRRGSERLQPVLDPVQRLHREASDDLANLPRADTLEQSLDRFDQELLHGTDRVGDDVADTLRGVPDPVERGAETVADVLPNTTAREMPAIGTATRIVHRVEPRFPAARLERDRTDDALPTRQV